VLEITAARELMAVTTAALVIMAVLVAMADRGIMAAITGTMAVN